MAKTKDKFEKIVQSAEDLSEKVSGSILGTYEGECADSNITNLNGLDITREVWEHVFASEEYKKAIKLKQYIGYLGHPEDPDCQDFRKACITMTEGHIDDNGKVYGKFDLIDTPVGRIVKAFQDAGVVFGISVRGAGDIIQNSVDPETFVFRGFDLVTFPAFPDSIPKFTAIAASTDTEQRKKYQAVCASVKANMDCLDTVQSIDIVQPYFAKQSDEYKELEARKSELLGENKTPELPLEPLAEPSSDPQESLEEAGVTECEEDECDPRVDSMTKLYLETKAELDDLKEAYQCQCVMYDELVKDNSRRIQSIERICSSQINDLTKNLETVEGSLEVKKNEVTALNTQLDRNNHRLSTIESSVSVKDRKSRDLEEKLSKVQSSLDSYKDKCRILKEENLKYNESVEAAQSTIKSQKSIIAKLRSQLDETVRKQTSEKQKSSNFDEQMESMKSRVQAAEALVKEYQQAYANLYANAVGVPTPKLRVTASTDVSNLQSLIRASASIPMKPDILEPTQYVDPSYIDVVEEDEDDLVTL